MSYLDMAKDAGLRGREAEDFARQLEEADERAFCVQQEPDECPGCISGNEEHTCNGYAEFQDLQRVMMDG